MPFSRVAPDYLVKEYTPPPFASSPLDVLVHPVIVSRGLVQIMVDFLMPGPDPDSGREDDNRSKQHSKVVPVAIRSE